MPTAIAGAREREGEGVATQWLDEGWREDGQGEEAEDHAGDRGQDLDDRLEPATEPRAGVLGEIDRCAQAQRCRHQHRDEGDDEGAADDRGQAVFAVAWLPGIGQQRAGIDALQEGDGVTQQRQHDGQRDDDGQRRRRKEGRADDPFPAASGSAALEVLKGDPWLDGHWALLMLPTWRRAKHGRRTGPRDVGPVLSNGRGREEESAEVRRRLRPWPRPRRPASRRGRLQRAARSRPPRPVPGPQH